MKFCTQCGQAAPDDHKFCMKCGAPFGEAAAAQVAAVPAPAAVVFTPSPPPAAKSSNQTVILILGAAVFFVIMPMIIVVAVAYPSLIRARSAANESAAVRSIRMLNSALGIYQHRFGHYPIALEQLTSSVPGATDSTHAGIIMEAAVRPRQRGYNFTYEASRSSDTADLDRYELRADPVDPGKSGVHHFFSDESQVIRWDENTASASSPKLDY